MARRSTTGVVLVEDEGLFRDLLRIALSQQSQIEVLGTFADGETALAQAPALRPRVAILDIELAGQLNGIQLGLRLRQLLPGLGIVLLSNHDEPELFFAVPRSQISGWSYLLKRSVSDAAALARAIEGSAAGFVVLDTKLVQGAERESGFDQPHITPRQREILTLMAQGYSNAAIARQLVLAEKSVENQINLLYRELNIDRKPGGMHPRVQAVLWFFQSGLRSRS